MLVKVGLLLFDVEGIEEWAATSDPIFIPAPRHCVVDVAANRSEKISEVQQDAIS